MQTIQAYRFIYDENEVRRFYRVHLAPFAKQNHVSFLLIPTARKKYWPDLSNHKTVIHSHPFSSHSDEDEFVRLIRRLEVAEGLYLDFHTNKAIPNEAFVIYITTNPLSEIRGFFAFQNEMNHKLEELILHPTTVNPLKLFSTMKSKIHSAPLKLFKKLDIDTKLDLYINSLKNLLRTNQIRPTLVVETRGGYHVVLNQTTLSGSMQQALHTFQLKQACFPEPSTERWMTIESNSMIAVAGTLQGGFPVKIVDNWLE